MLCRVGHFDLPLHKQPNEVLFCEVPVKENGAENPIEDRGLPFDEPFVFQVKREAAEEHDHGEADPEGRFDLLAFELEPEDLKESRDNRDDRCEENGGGERRDAVAQNRLCESERTFSAPLNVAKKRMMGRKSKRSFICGWSNSKRCRVETGGLCAIGRGQRRRSAKDTIGAQGSGIATLPLQVENEMLR